MTLFATLFRPLACVVGLACVAGPGWAAGQQTGWCIGVGNKHSTSACTAGTPQLVAPLTQVPDVNEVPSQQTGPVRGPTPQVVTLQVLAPVEINQRQRPELPVTSTPPPQVLLQAIQRPRPLQAARSPDVPVIAVPPVVIGPRPPERVVTLTPPQPPIAVPPGQTTQAVPLPLAVPSLARPASNGPSGPGPSSVSRPLDGPTIAVPPVIVPLPPERVVTVTPPQPPIAVPPGQTTQAVPLPLAVPSLARPASNGPSGPGPSGDGRPLIERPPLAKPHGGGSAWVVRLPGRQPAHALPTRADQTQGGAPVHCVASGFGWRQQARADGGWDLIGFHPHLRTTDIVVRDIPANHHSQAGCVVEVVRRHAVGP